MAWTKSRFDWMTTRLEYLSKTGIRTTEIFVLEKAV